MFKKVSASHHAKTRGWTRGKNGSSIGTSQESIIQAFKTAVKASQWFSLTKTKKVYKVIGEQGVFIFQVDKKGKSALIVTCYPS